MIKFGSYKPVYCCSLPGPCFSILAKIFLCVFLFHFVFIPFLFFSFLFLKKRTQGWILLTAISVEIMICIRDRLSDVLFTSPFAYVCRDVCARWGEWVCACLRRWQLPLTRKDMNEECLKTGQNSFILKRSRKKHFSPFENRVKWKPWKQRRDTIHFEMNQKHCFQI